MKQYTILEKEIKMFEAETRPEVIERIIAKHLECLHDIIKSYPSQLYDALMEEKEKELRKNIT